MSNGSSQNSTTDRIAAAYNTISQSINPRQMLHIQLTTSQIKVLIGFAEQDRLNMGDLSRLHGVSVSTMTSMVGRLIQGGLLKRHSDKTDRRIVQIALTERGRKITADLLKARRQALKRFLSRLSEREASRFVASIEYVAQCLSKTRLAKADKKLLKL